jgi:hypothetical protein
MSLLKLWFIRNPVLVSYSICIRHGSSDLSGSQSALACLCVCTRAQLELREFSSTLSTKYASMILMDIKNYYIRTPLPRFEYMKMLLSRFPEEIVQKYNLNVLAVDGWVYIEFEKECTV